MREARANGRRSLNQARCSCDSIGRRLVRAGGPPVSDDDEAILLMIRSGWGYSACDVDEKSIDNNRMTTFDCSRGKANKI